MIPSAQPRVFASLSPARLEGDQSHVQASGGRAASSPALGSGFKLKHGVLACAATSSLSDSQIPRLLLQAARPVMSARLNSQLRRPRHPNPDPEWPKGWGLYSPLASQARRSQTSAIVSIRHQLASIASLTACTNFKTTPSRDIELPVSGVWPTRGATGAHSSFIS